jgi:hypothetical protein
LLALFPRASEEEQRHKDLFFKQSVRPRLKMLLTPGMPISDAFAQIEHQPNIYDVVHVKYFGEVRPRNVICCFASYN